MIRMLKASGAMGAATMLSRILGMVREICYARFMGDGWVAGAFVLAFMIPNLFRRLLGEGALTAAFIPIFKEKEAKAGETEMWRTANAVLSALIVAACAIVGLVTIGITLALGNAGLAQETRLMLELLRIMFPYMLLVCVTAVLIGMLNARGVFFLPAMGATLLNVVMITATLWIAPRSGGTLDEQIFTLAFAVLVAGTAQAAFQWPSLRIEGFRYRWVSPWRNETVRLVVRRMIPGMLGVAAFQINVLITQCVAYAVDPSIVASFNYAVRLMELPQGVFGVSLATFLLPTLSGMAAASKLGEFRRTLSQAMGLLFYVNMVTGVFLLVLAEPIVRLLFERGEFDAGATSRSAQALICLAPALVGFSLTALLARAFFALGDTRTPMKIGALCLALNLVIVVVLVVPMRQAGLALANSITATLSVVLLARALRRRRSEIHYAEFGRAFVRVLAMALLAGALAWALSLAWENQFGHASLALKIGAVFVPMGLASAVYWAATLRLKIEAATEIRNMFKRRSRG